MHTPHLAECSLPEPCALDFRPYMDASFMGCCPLVCLECLQNAVLFPKNKVVNANHMRSAAEQVQPQLPCWHAHS